MIHPFKINTLATFKLCKEKDFDVIHTQIFTSTFILLSTYILYYNLILPLKYYNFTINLVSQIF